MGDGFDWGVSGRACTPTLCGISGHATRPNGVMPYIQHHHFSATIAPHWRAIFWGNRRPRHTHAGASGLASMGT
jgi:hypothetical protein